MSETTIATYRPQSLVSRFNNAMTLHDVELDHLRFIAVVGLVALNACDLILTRHLLTTGGHEANPVMAAIIAGGWGIAIKLGIPFLAGLRHLTAPLKRSAVLALCWVCVLYFGIVLWNTHLTGSIYG